MILSKGYMRKFKHFIIIKFDYPAGYPFFDTKSQQLRWTCLETLRNQTCREFVMVFNSTSPMPHEGFGELIISPCWKDKVRDAAKDYEYVITTRLDGDDFVAPDFVEQIQKNFEETEKLILATDGWIYDARVDKAVDNWTYKRYVMNSFSFIEKSDNIETCYVRPHSKMKMHYKVKWIDKKLHIWCINLESLKAWTKPSEYYMGDRPDKKEEIISLHPERYGLILKRVMQFNDMIGRIKKELDKKKVKLKKGKYKELWEQTKKI